MKIKIARQERVESFEIPFESTTLLKALFHIKHKVDNSLTFSSNCRSGVCGACAVRVNGKEVLSCSYNLKEDDLVEPLAYHSIYRDLKVDKKRVKDTLTSSLAWLQKSKKVEITKEQVAFTEKQTDCILCDSCYSSCPVLEVNSEFIGPFALTRAYRYISDPRESGVQSIVDNIQTNGIWDCTLCGNCTEVCPQGIDPKMDITMLRGVSAKFGYSDPNFQAMDFSFGGF